MNIYHIIDKEPTKTSIYWTTLSLLKNNFPGVSHISAHLITEALATFVLNYFKKIFVKQTALEDRNNNFLQSKGKQAYHPL